MFETPQFRDQLVEVVAREAGMAGLKTYENSTIQYLQDLARGNEPALMENELKKSASERRGIREALGSATLLAQEASRYATADRRTVLQRSDIEKAYQAKFCQIWPFCK